MSGCFGSQPSRLAAHLNRRWEWIPKLLGDINLLDRQLDPSPWSLRIKFPFVRPNL